jgi:hypothetical protein
MTLSDLSSIGSLVSGLAVLVSLVYLSLQVRQTEKNQRALMNQGVLSRGVSLGVYLTQPHINDVWTRVLSGETEFSAPEISQLTMAMRTKLLNLQDAFVQHSAGLIDDITFENAFNMAKAFMAQPIYRALWTRSRETFASDMSAMVDRIVQQSPPAKPIDLVAQLEADLAKVKR